MNFKKFALLILTVVAISGFYAKPVSASANNEESTIQTTGENETVSALSGEEVTTSVELATDTNGNATVSDEQQTDSAVSETAAPKTAAVESKAAKGTTSSTTKAVTKKSYSNSDLRLMASIINCEAGAEGFQGKIAVGIVVMNRVASKDFPNTIKKVIYQKNQFSPVRNGMLAKKLKQYDAGKTGSAQWKSCISAAKKVLEGQRTIIYKGKTKSLKGYHFFSVVLPGARMKLGGHRFK